MLVALEPADDALRGTAAQLVNVANGHIGTCNRTTWISQRRHRRVAGKVLREAADRGVDP
jgi:hypothetical protein